METDSGNTRLYSADSNGFISVWNIETYCVDSAEKHTAPRKYVTYSGRKKLIYTVSNAKHRFL